MPLMTGSRRGASEADDSSDEEMEEEQVREEEEEDEEEEGGEEEGEPEYEVEKIMGHKYEGSTLKYHVKWKGYDDPADRTWEPEDTLADVEALEVYLKEIGGRPTQTPGKRGRKSAGGAGTPVPKKNRVKQESAATKSIDNDEEDDWKPPEGSWENDILMIETLERDRNQLVCYVQWVNGKKTQHPTTTIYDKCPQKMLKFYEGHLVFRDSAGAIKTQE